MMLLVPTKAVGMDGLLLLDPFLYVCRRGFVNLAMHATYRTTAIVRIVYRDLGNIKIKLYLDAY